MEKQRAGEFKSDYLKRIEENRDLADLKAIEGAKHLNNAKNKKEFDETLADIQRFRNESRYLTQLAVDIADEIKTERFVDRWEKANK